MDRQYYVYILGNRLNTVLYTGVTGGLCKRVREHKQEIVPGFTKKYHIRSLLYYELYTDPVSAIEREKQIKNWNRKKKNTLILKINPHLEDLYSTLCK